MKQELRASPVLGPTLFEDEVLARVCVRLILSTKAKGGHLQECRHRVSQEQSGPKAQAKQTKQKSKGQAAEKTSKKAESGGSRTSNTDDGKK